MSQFIKSKRRVELTPGISLRVARESAGLSQNDLADEADIPQSTISSIESGRIALGVERAKRLAIVLGIHPAVLLFPNWKVEPRAKSSKKVG